MIKHLEIKRFKKFEHTVVTLNDLTVLVGENSSGKTTILQAINLSLNAFARQNEDLILLSLLAVDDLCFFALLPHFLQVFLHAFIHVDRPIGIFCFERNQFDY